jgi:ABC-2 type transport system ATP-binding protein
MAGVLLETKGLGRDFGGTRALNAVDLTLDAGAPIGLVGPNGAGKTTLFSVVCGFLRPTRGSVHVFGRPPLHRDLHGRVGILPQDAAFVKGVPVASQLAMLAELQGFGRKQARAEAARVLDMVLLADAASKAPEMLSHGMLKRIAIAQTFMGTPELVLLDEPTAGLDPATASHIKNLIRSLDRQRTFIVSSHNLDDIEELCGSVVILDRGKIVEHRKVADLIARTSCLTFRLEADAPAGLDAKLAALPNVTRVDLGRPGERKLAVHYRDGGDGGAGGNATQIAVLQALAAAGVAMLEMSRGQSLQDKVIEITRPATT